MDDGGKPINSVSKLLPFTSHILVWGGKGG